VGRSWDEGGYQARVWFRMLQDLPVEAVQSAVLAYLGETEIPGFPSPGAIRKRAIILLRTEGGPQDSLSAWDLVLSCSRDYSLYDQERTLEALKRLDPITTRALKSVGGLHSVASTTNLPTLRAQFLKSWDALIRKETTQALLPEPEKVRKINRQLKLLPEVMKTAEGMGETK